MFCFGCQKCSVPRGSPDVPGKQLPPDNGTAIRREQSPQGALGVTSLAVVLIASSEDGYCPSSFVIVPYFAVLVTLSGCILDNK